MELSGRLMDPHDLGFDASKFPTFREGQLETSQEVADSTKPLFLVEAPTGSGKSLLALVAHKLLKEPRGAYLVSTKQLQDQLEADFHLPVVKGRGNFPCLHFEHLFPEVTSEVCHEYLGNRECEFIENCLYLVQKRKALASPMCILNYPLFLTEANFVKGFSNLGFLIMDEVDTVEDHLMNFVEVEINQWLMQLAHLGVPHLKTKPAAWREWCTQASDKLRGKLAEMGPKENVHPGRIKLYTRLSRAVKKLRFLSEALDDGWVMEVDEYKDEVKSITFKPIKVGGYAPTSIWKHTSRSLGMSATVMGHQAMAIELGLHSWDVDFRELPSPFPIEDRRVQYIPVANVTHKTKDVEYPKLAKAVHEVLNKHPKEKVLVHAVSYDLKNYLVNNVNPFYHRIMTHTQKDRAQVLEEFKASILPTVLISPSMERGVDLPGDLCRVVIVAKVPYPSLGSPQVSRRLYGFSDGNLWYGRRAARTLVQMTGRATRFKGDYSISYILDSQFGQLVARNGSIFPTWWRSAVTSGSL